jgi:farnesyl diphosphate synthase
MQDAMDRLEDVKAQVQTALEEAMAHLPPGELTDAMRYACIGGKRIRAFLVMESARLFGIEDSAALPVAAAVEALHAYSLVHDDLPSMDDDDLRRGLPTVHVQWSEATAILAGDALQSLAFGLFADEPDRCGGNPPELLQGFAEASARAAWSGGRRRTSPPKPPSSRLISGRSSACSRPRPGR